MKQRTRDLYAAILGAVTLAIAAGVTGCQEVNTRNDPVFVSAADQFVNRTVGPEYVDYVMADPALGTPGETTPLRRDRIANVDTFRQAVTQAQQEINETGGGAQD